MTPYRVALVLIASLLMLGCSEPQETASKPQIQVNLPPPPKLPPLPHPAKYDGTVYSVVGLKRQLIMRRGEKIWDTDQTVRGYVVEHYENPCPKRAQDCLGKEPHFWIADDLNAPKEERFRLTVVPSWPEDGDKLKEMFQVGMQYDFKGRFTTLAGNGYADANGLLNIDCPPEICPVAEDSLAPTGSALPPRRPGMP